MISKDEASEPGQRPGGPSRALLPSTSALENFFVWPLTAATLVGQANARLLNEFLWSGRFRVANGPLLPWTTPNKVALELPSMRLRDFSIGTEDSATVVCAPYALHAATIADCSPGHSIVETLGHGGLSRLFVTDWRSATPEMRYFTIDSYLADLNVVVDELGPPVNLIGLCQGGWLALVYAARFPKKVRRLILVGAPVDIAAAESPLSRFVAEFPIEMFDEWVRLGKGIVHSDQILKFWPISASEADRVLDLAQLRVPIFLLAAANDEIVPTDQLLATGRLVGTPAEQLEQMIEPCGHLSRFLGRAVLEEAWREIARRLSS
jgi:poly(3-hydroxyalkanoate) synthetase